MDEQFNIKGSGKEAKERFKFDQQRRNAAANILTPHEAATGIWDAAKVLKTTLGGVKRDITGEDLAAFRRNAQAVANRFQPGITPKQVISFSLSSRLERARKEITMAVPVYGSTMIDKNKPSAVVRFLTNAGPDCQQKNKKHNVMVQFMSFYAAVNASGMEAQKAAKWLRKEKILFDCDCEDHTFRFRYIASTGKFAYGRQETGYPKETNPLLKGVACKHVIRVMQQIESSTTVVNYLAKMIDKARRSQTGHSIAQTTQKQAEAIAKRQKAKPAQIKTAEQKKQERLAAKARRESIPKLKTQQEEIPHKKKKPSSRRINQISAADAKEAELRQVMAQLGVEPTQEQIDTVRRNAT